VLPLALSQRRVPGLFCSVAQTQVHPLFLGSKEDCYRKMDLFIEFYPSASAFAARVESEQDKKKKKKRTEQSTTGNKKSREKTKY